MQCTKLSGELVTNSSTSILLDFVSSLDALQLEEESCTVNNLNDNTIVDTNASTMDKARYLLRPGSGFIGSIAIPGDSAPAPYGIYILEENSTGFIATHAAHGDQQVVCIQIHSPVLTDNQVGLSFYDEETYCKGKLDVSTGIICGQVSQLSFGEEGFFVPRDETTHIFHVQRRNSCSTLIDIRCRRRSTLRMFIKFFSPLLLETVWVNENSDHLKKVRPYWSMLLSDSILNGEEVACKLRGFSRILKELRFDTPEDKINKMSSININRAEAHEIINEAMNLVKGCMLGCFLYNEITDEQKIAAMQQPAKLSNRLRQVYNHFDEQLLATEKRISLAAVQKYQRVITSQESLQDDCVCSICTVPWDELDNLVISSLQCGHIFHVECFSTWMHWHNTCPNCRAVVDE